MRDQYENHGEADGNVDVEQSKIMDRALKQAGHQVELITFKNEDHSDWEPGDEKAALADVFNFISAYITPAPLPPQKLPLDAPSAPAG